MDQIFPKLYSQYIRERDRLVPSNSAPEKSAICVDDVLRSHFLLTDYFIREGEEIALAGVRNDNLLLSALGRQYTGWGNTQKWSTPYQKVATLFYGLVKDHPFHDGNKRSAFLVALLHLSNFGLVPLFRQKTFEEITVRTAANQLRGASRSKPGASDDDADVLFLASFFKTNTRKTDKRRYEVTYRDLHALLGRFGFGLENPHKNFIDVVRYEKRRKMVGLRIREVVEPKKIFNVVFPGWTKRAKKDTVKGVRSATGLTSEKGYDSAVFFKGHDSLPALIDKYHGPLLRLKDK